MVKFMFKVQARNTSGKAKKKGGDKFEVFIVGPDVCIYLIYILRIGNCLFSFNF